MLYFINAYYSNYCHTDLTLFNPLPSYLQPAGNIMDEATNGSSVAKETSINTLSNEIYSVYLAREN